MDELFTFYLEELGWLLLAVPPLILLVFVVIDNQRNQRGAIGWIVLMLLCVVVFLPAGIYDLGPEETRASLLDLRVTIFYIGVMGLIGSILLFSGYLYTNRLQQAVVPTSIPPPPVSNAPGDDVGETVIQQLSSAPNPVPAPRYPAPPPARPPARQSVRDDEPSTVIGKKERRNPANAWLIDNANESRRYNLYEGKNIIGRGKEHDISLSDPAVSRDRHAMIIMQRNDYILRDLGSSYGTFLNDQRIDGEIQVRHGDVIRVGDTELSFVAS